MIKEAILKLAKKQDLTYAEAEAVMNDMLSITQRQRETFMSMLTGAKLANLVEQSRQKTA